MGDIISIAERLNEKNIGKLLTQLDELHNKGLSFSRDFSRLLEENPNEAVKKIANYLDSAKYGGVEKRVVGIDPNQDYTGPILDLFGNIYPIFDRETRKEGLSQCLSFLDKLNYFQAQFNVEYINEPWLAADILINRGLYWCGYQEYCDILGETSMWKDLSERLGKMKSRFWLAMAIINYKHSSLEIRTKFYKEFPNLIDRAQDAIAALTFNHAQNADKRDGTPVEEYIDESLSKYDPILHNKIRKKMGEKKWIRIDPNVGY